jgi:hypothetical protein
LFALTTSLRRNVVPTVVDAVAICTELITLASREGARAACAPIIHDG